MSLFHLAPSPWKLPTVDLIIKRGDQANPICK